MFLPASSASSELFLSDFPPFILSAWDVSDFPSIPILFDVPVSPSEDEFQLSEALLSEPLLLSGEDKDFPSEELSEPLFSAEPDCSFSEASRGSELDAPVDPVEGF